MLSASLHLYFRAWETELGVKWEEKKREREKLFKQKGLVGYVNELERLLKLPCGNCPAELELLEQITLARNAAQHPAKITDLMPEHRKSDLEKYPRPFFMTESESTFLKGDLADVSFLVPGNRTGAQAHIRIVRSGHSPAASTRESNCSTSLMKQKPASQFGWTGTFIAAEDSERSRQMGTDVWGT